MALSDEQIEIIEKIPSEGALRYQDDSGFHFHFSEDDRADVVQHMLGAVGPAQEGSKTAIIMMGAPGAGKTRIAVNMHVMLPEDLREHVALIAYNEGGAEEFCVPLQEEFDELAEDASADERLAVQKRYQPFTQNCQNAALKEALRRESSLIVDITAAGRGAEFMITKTLRPLQFDHIHIEAVFAPFAISKERCETRLRPSDPIMDVVAKRIGVLAYMGSHAAHVDSFSLDYNPRNGQDPRRAMDIDRHGVRYDAGLMAQMAQDLVHDRDAVLEHLKEHNFGGDALGPIMKEYEEATEKMLAFLRERTGLELNAPVSSAKVIRPVQFGGPRQG